MRRFARPPLEPSVRAYLKKRQFSLDQEADPSSAARSHWKKARETQRFVRVLLSLKAMNDRSGRCMYCEHDRGGTIDHWAPQSQYPERTFSWGNLFLACPTCNQVKQKRFPLAEDGTPLLIKPDVDDPLDHLELDTTTGKYQAVPGSPRGDPSIDIYRLNDQELMDGRRDAWHALGRLLKCYMDAAACDNIEQCHSLLSELCRYPFRSVFEEMIHLYRHKHHAALEPVAYEALERYTELYEWLER